VSRDYIRSFTVISWNRGVPREVCAAAEHACLLFITDPEEQDDDDKT